ncbi:MAG: glycosyltransferase [Weeksellaceae bacterium]|nr:glycosyltransferase [Weeksellaceae bacterium]
MPFYSIIIPTYNSEKTLAAALESVLQQRFSDFEVLIMDGLSSDRTVEIAQSFGDERIKIFSEKDGGVYEAMNKGIDRAQGEWLYFLGSDDTLYDDGVLEKFAKEVEDQDLVYGNAWFIKIERSHAGEINREILMTQTNICHQAIFYNKNLFTKLGGYNLIFPIWADWDFNVRCFSLPEIKIKYVDLLVANYNDFGGISVVQDQEYLKYLPLKYKEKVVIENFKALSTDYKLGNKILKPIRWIKHRI